MSEQGLEQAIRAALAAVRHDDGRDIVEAGNVQEIVVSGEGDVQVAFILRPGEPGALVKEARAAAEAVEGVRSVKVNVQLPAAAPAPAGAPRPGGGGGAPGTVPAPTPKPGILPDVAHVVAVSSGKGGVGKSMVSANLAAALAAEGLRVGLLDADVYGPNIPLMFGEQRRPRVTGEKGAEMIEPLEAHGVRIMSLGLMMDPEQPAIMRGPLISGILRQFLEQVDWGSLDVLVVDMPPGTGDAQLSLVQTIDLDGAVMVTTSQNVATGDVRRGIRMFERVNTRVLGVVENMAGYTLSNGETIDIFGTGGGERLAEEMGVPFLGRVPLDPAVREAGDEGRPTVLAAPDSPAGSALRAIAASLRETLERGGRG
ncbi:MAG: MRP family ATP-binding protein [Gemmatimonadetes bacterium]|nr:MAG: MRP family ATP-binding protein [Gemmatimonadota bacterium]